MSAENDICRVTVSPSFMELLRSADCLDADGFFVPRARPVPELQSLIFPENEPKRSSPRTSRGQPPLRIATAPKPWRCPKCKGEHPAAVLVCTA